MLNTTLSPCANLLYQWILTKENASITLKIDLQDFQAWTGEYRDEPYNDAEILEALKELKEQYLIATNKTEISLKIIKRDDISLIAKPPAQLLLEEQQPENPKLFKLIIGLTLASCVVAALPFAYTLSVSHTQQLNSTPLSSKKPIKPPENW